LELCVIWYILDEVTGRSIMAINLKPILYFHLVSIKLELVSIPKVVVLLLLLLLLLSLLLLLILLLLLLLLLL